MKRQSNALLTALIFHELFFLPGEGGGGGGGGGAEKFLQMKKMA